jgi:hypothetical protein
VTARKDQADQAHAARVKARFLREIDQAFVPFRRTGRITFLVLLGCTVVFLPIALGLSRRLLRRSEDEELFLHSLRRAREFARRATPVIAYPLMVSSVLRSTTPSRATGLVITTFELPAHQDLRFMARLAESLSRGNSTEGEAGRWSKEQRSSAEALMANEDYRPFRRRKIPQDMTREHSVYACDLFIEPEMLPGGRLSDEYVLFPCMAEPGDSGLIFLLPYWMANAPDKPATAAQVEEFKASLIYFEAVRRAASTGKE